MNTQGGKLDFEFDLNIDPVQKKISVAKSAFSGLASSVKKEGESIDRAFDVTTENLKIQKTVIASIEDQIKHLNNQISKTAPGMAQNDLRKQSQALTNELNSEKKALLFLEQQIKETEAAHVSFRTQLRQVREELINMERAGLRGTAAYDELQIKAGKLKDSYGDAQKQMAVLANDERGFQGVISMMSGVTGAFSAAQGAVGLFAGENENLTKIMLKVQSLMAITIGLQQVAETLNKDSYFSIVVLTKVKEALAAAELKLAAAFGVSTTAARVFMATVTLGISAAITAVVVVITKMVQKQKEAAKEMQNFNKATADAAYKSYADFEKLRQGWERLGNSLKDKKKFIDDNADSFKELGVETNNVLDAENLLVTNKDAFVQSIIAKAKAAAGMELAAAKYKESLEKMLEAEKMSDTKTITKDAGYMGMGGYKTAVVANTDKIKKKQEAAKLEKEAQDLVTGAVKATEDATDLLNKANINSVDKIVEGSVGAIEAAVEKRKEALKKLTNAADYKDAEKQIANLERQLAYIKGNGQQYDLDKFTEQLGKAKKLYQEYEAAKAIDGEKAAQKQFAQLEDDYELYLRKLHDKYKNNPAFISVIDLELSPMSKAREDSINKQMEEWDKKRKEANKQNIDDYNKQLQILEGISKNEKQRQKDILAQAAAEAKLNTGLARSANISKIIADSFSGMDGKIAEAARQISDEFDRLSKISKDFNVLGDSSSTFTEQLNAGADAFATVAAQIIQVVQAFKSMNENKAASKLESALLRVSFALDEINRSASAEKLQKYKDALAEISKTGKTIISDFDTRTIEEIQNSLLHYQSQQGSKWFDSQNEKIQDHIDMYTKLLDLKKNELELQREMNEALTGTTSESITDAIMQGFEDGYKTVEDFGKTFEDTIRKAILNGFKMKLIQPAMDKFYIEFAKAQESGGGISTQEQEYLKKKWDAWMGQFTEGVTVIDQMFKDWGFDTTTTQNTLSGSIKGITEDTADVLAGTMNAMRLNGIQQLAVAQSGLMTLQKIADNTYQIGETNSLLKDIRSKVGGSSQFTTNRALGH